MNLLNIYEALDPDELKRMKGEFDTHRKRMSNVRKSSSRWSQYQDFLPSRDDEKNTSGTSQAQVPSGIWNYMKVLDEFPVDPDDDGLLLNLDYGGGRYNFGKAALRKMGVRSEVYDLYSRSQIHNKSVKKKFKNKKADTVTLLNVLNVIEDHDDRVKAVKDAWSMLKKDGIMIVQVHVAPKAGPTSAGYQLAKPLKKYEKEFSDAVRRKPDGYIGNQYMVFRK